jgi:hypothetical protein
LNCIADLTGLLIRLDLSCFSGKEVEISQAEMDLKTASDVFQRLQSSIEFSERELKAKEAELSRKL